MTTQYAVLPARSGRTLTAKLFTLAAPDTVAFTADSVTERTNAKGEYLCTFGEASAISGDHKLVLFYGSLAAAIGFVTFAGTDTETATETPPTVELDSATILAVADQVWDEAMSGHTTAGTYGGRIVRATNSNNEVQITGSNHIAADVHDFQTGVITAGDFAANSITASALATDAVTEIQSGLATSAALATESGKITNIENASGYLLAVLAGACADPQTASETYAITVFGSTFTVDMAGQTSTGTRTAPTLTKT